MATEDPKLAKYLLDGQWHTIQNWNDVRTALKEADAIRLPGDL